MPGFTLVELLLVMGIMAALMVLAVPAVNGIKRGGDLTAAANEMEEILEAAATYARASDTYVWVGFYEEDVTSEARNPATPGTGRVVVSVVASNDGTQLINPSAPAGNIPPSKLMQVGKLHKLANVHLTDLPAPLTPSTSGTGRALDTRPDVNRAGVTYRIGESTPIPTKFPFVYPLNAPRPQYTFTKTIAFTPRGEALMNSSPGLVPWLEVGVSSTHGNIKEQSPLNQIAIQIAGISCQTKIYRK